MLVTLESLGRGNNNGSNSIRLQFDPLTHLAYEQPSHRHSLTELGLDPLAKDNKSSAVAVTDLAFTEPFRLLSDAGVQVSARPVLV